MYNHFNTNPAYDSWNWFNRTACDILVENSFRKFKILKSEQRCCLSDRAMIDGSVLLCMFTSRQVYFIPLTPSRRGEGFFSALTSLFSVPKAICHAFRDVFWLGICLSISLVSLEGHTVVFFFYSGVQTVPRAMGYVLRISLHIFSCTLSIASARFGCI